MIQFITLFAAILAMLFYWDVIESAVMSLGEYIETIRDQFAAGNVPATKLGILVGGAAAAALVISLIL